MSETRWFLIDGLRIAAALTVVLAVLLLLAVAS